MVDCLLLGWLMMLSAIPAEASKLVPPQTFRLGAGHQLLGQLPHEMPSWLWNGVSLLQHGIVGEGPRPIRLHNLLQYLPRQALVGRIDLSEAHQHHVINVLVAKPGICKSCHDLFDSLDVLLVGLEGAE